jgi:hypothetical protein
MLDAHPLRQRLSTDRVVFRLSRSSWFSLAFLTRLYLPAPDGSPPALRIPAFTLVFVLMACLLSDLLNAVHMPHDKETPSLAHAGDNNVLHPDLQISCCQVRLDLHCLAPFSVDGQLRAIR